MSESQHLLDRTPVRTVALGVLLVVTLGVYLQVKGFEFVNIDDGLYVSENGRVQQGLTLDNLGYALTTTETGSWYPLTWLSHMATVALFGTGPGPHHLMSVFVHVLNTLLLALVLFRYTGAFWRGLLVAALFALHPLHVESVAWIAERKDTLSTLFSLLLLFAYVRFTEKQERGRRLVVLVVFAFALMSKSMAVTLPCVLLLLDFWPLKRIEANELLVWKSWAPLLKEKLALFGLAAIVSLVTFFSQRASGAMNAFEDLSLSVKIQNALISYGHYLWKMVWPTDLTVHYPHPGENVNTVLAIGCAIALVAVTLLAYSQRSKRPHLLVGWLWYVGTLVPVIGIIQVGGTAIADRYTYITLVGVWIAIAWSVPDRARIPVPALTGLSVACLLLLTMYAGMTTRQVGYWKNSGRLFAHNLEVAPENNAMAHFGVGHFDIAQGDYESGLEHMREVITLQPDHAVARNSIGVSLLALGKLEEADSILLEAVELDPSLAIAHFNLARVKVEQRRLEEAVSHLNRSLRRAPDHTPSVALLGSTLLSLGRAEEALPHLEAAAASAERDAASQANLGVAYAQLGRPVDAARQFEKTLRLEPAHSAAHFNLGSIGLTNEDYAGAEMHFRAVVEARPDSVDALSKLALTEANLGRVDDARKHLAEALALDPNYTPAKDLLAQLGGASGRQ